MSLGVYVLSILPAGVIFIDWSNDVYCVWSNTLRM